jgi:hypothetical protein
VLLEKGAGNLALIYIQLCGSSRRMTSRSASLHQPVSVSQLRPTRCIVLSTRSSDFLRF